MSTPNQTDRQNQDRIPEIIRAIEDKSESGDYIYRGEPNTMGK